MVASGSVKQQHVVQNKVVGNVHEVVGEALDDDGKGKHKSKGEIEERKKRGTKGKTKGKKRGGKERRIKTSKKEKGGGKYKKE
jgi:hypothetical protein